MIVIIQDQRTLGKNYGVRFGEFCRGNGIAGLKPPWPTLLRARKKAFGQSWSDLYALHGTAQILVMHRMSCGRSIVILGDSGQGNCFLPPIRSANPLFFVPGGHGVAVRPSLYASGHPARNYQIPRRPGKSNCLDGSSESELLWMDLKEGDSGQT